MSTCPRRRAGAAIATLAVLLAGCAGHSRPAQSGAARSGPAQSQQSGAIGANARVGDVLLRNVYVANAPTGSDQSPPTVRLTLVNQGDQPDALTGATTDVARRVEIRSGSGCDGTGQTLTRVDLPRAGGAPDGGYVLRLVDLKVGFLQAASIPITFTFSNAGSITVPTPVEGGPLGC